MNNGWSEHHRALHMKEIDGLQRKLDEIKAAMVSRVPRNAETFRRVMGRLPTPGEGCGNKHDTTGFCFLCNKMVGPDAAATEQIGGA